MVGATGGGDVIFLHGFEERRLRLGRRAVDLVGKNNLGEDRPLHESQPPRALFFVEDFGAGDIRRHQVGRELDPLVIQIEDVGERLDQQRLRQTRYAGDQTVAGGE